MEQSSPSFQSHGLPKLMGGAMTVISFCARHRLIARDLRPVSLELSKRVFWSAPVLTGMAAVVD